MRIESIEIKNYRVFQDVRIGDANNCPLPNLSVFVGANGSGKTTLFDVFGFLRDALIGNVRTALQKRGRFQEVRSRNTEGPIAFEIKFRESLAKPLVTYDLEIDERNGLPVVAREILKYRRGSRGQPWHFLDFSEGRGSAITNEMDAVSDERELQREDQVLESPEILAIKGLGQFQKFQAASLFRRLIENWHVSDFHIGEARPSQEAGVAEHLSVSGDNLPLVAQFLYERHRDIFKDILDKMAQRVPGVSHVDARSTEDGRIVLRFQDGAFKDPFIAKYVSDGTIKMFAYLVLLHDPSPHPLLCVEEPENQLYPRLLDELAEEFREYTSKGGQVMVSTHSPDFLNAVKLDEVYWLTKKDGYTQVRRAADVEQLRRLVDEGDALGSLWKQGFFEGADPK
ncbi:MAG: AAA family ATPase [Pirellulaceae bacterium]|nr:AAA family ATPase [Pirellulaceae bacterium]